MLPRLLSQYFKMATQQNVCIFVGKILGKFKTLAVTL